MRILQVCADKGVPPGGTKGASAHLRHVAAALTARGHRVRTVARRAAEGHNPHPVPVDVLAGEESLVDSISALGGADLIYERYSLGHLAGLQMASRIGVPFVLEVNAPLVLEAAAHRAAAIDTVEVEAERRLFAEADVVMAVSTALADHVASVRGHRDGVLVTPNGADPHGFPTAAHHRGQPQLVFLGHPKPWHGADRLPLIAASLRRRFPAIEVLVVGGGPGIEPIMARAAALDVADAFRITGPVADGAIAGHLAGGSVGLAPYPSSDFFYFSPLKVVEYMMAGLPVVTTDVGDVATTVGSGGIVVPPDDVEELTAACAYLLDRPVLRRHMGRSSRSRAFRDHTWDGVAAAVERSVLRVGAA
ncbi:MAG: glycosyltransferase family 4 protein [Acidimicrobiia bacterium]